MIKPIALSLALSAGAQTPDNLRPSESRPSAGAGRPPGAILTRVTLVTLGTSRPCRPLGAVKSVLSRHALGAG